MTRPVLVLVHRSHATLARAHREVDPDCALAITTTPGIVALVLPEDLRRRPETPNLELSLAAIARDFVHPQEPARPSP